MNCIICNAGQKSFFVKLISEMKLIEDDVVFIIDNYELHTAFSNIIIPMSFILVDVETDFGNYGSDFFGGFDIAADLRRIYKIRNQIVFHSTFSKEYFEKLSQSDIKFKLLYGRGSSFIRYPFSVEAIKEKLLNTTPISAATLHDVVTMLCDLKGIVIDKLNHELRFEKDVKNLQQLFSTIEPYLSNEQKQLIEMAEFMEKLLQSIKNNDRSMFLSHKDLFLRLCTRHLTQSGNIESRLGKSKHTILLIDDREDELEKYEEELLKDFDVLKTSSGTEAIEILKSDSTNNIKAIISDWRLFEDDTLTYWQSLQGYEILEFASKSGIRALFALTSQADYVVHHIRNLMGIRFSMFKKENLISPGQWKVFADVLQEACNETLQIIANIPESDNWRKAERVIDKAEEDRIKKKNSGRNILVRKDNNTSTTYVSYPSLHQQYLGYLHDKDRDSLFRAVEEKADEIWQYLIGLRNEHNEYIGVDVLRHRFNVETPKDALLFPVLVLRRIWMALWYYHVGEPKKLSQEEITKYSKFIYAVIQYQGFTQFVGNNQSVEQTKLCISISQVRNRKMLPEEYAWMRKWQILVVG